MRKLKKSLDAKNARGLSSGKSGKDAWRGSDVQTLLFERPQWTAIAAQAWAREHGFRSSKVHATEDHLRLRQFPPVRGRQKRTITFGDGIKAVIEQVK